MYKHLLQIGDYWQGKILAGMVAVVFSEDLLVLLAIFVSLELLDIFTRWLALSRDCFLHIYPTTRCSLWRAFRFLWQARKWRWIKSDGLRDGFCDKMLIYLILLLLSGLVDGALYIAKSPRVMLTITTTVLAATEALSILENLSECDVAVIGTIKEKVKNKIEGR